MKVKMQDGEGEEPKAPESEAPAEGAEAPKPEAEAPELTPEEEKKAAAIAKSIISSVQAARQKSADVVEKQAKVTAGYAPSASVGRKKIKFYTDRKGKDHFIESADLEQASKWFKAIVNKDHNGVKKFYEQMQTKLGDTLVEGTNARGGFLIPTLLWDQIVPILEDQAFIRANSYVIDMSGMKTSTLNIDSIATRPLMTWTGENVSKSSSSMTLAQNSLTPYKLAAFVTMSDELLEDSPFNLVQMITSQFAAAIAAEEDRAFMTGSGTGRPTGLNTYTYRGFDAGGATTVDEMNRLYWMLPQQHRTRASWIMNSRAIAAISGLLDANGRPIFQDEYLDSGAPAIKGRPVIEQNDYESASIMLIDLSYYFIAHKGPFTVALADQAYVGGVSLFQNNLVAIRVEERIDGELVSTRAGVEMTNTGIS